MTIFCSTMNNFDRISTSKNHGLNTKTSDFDALPYPASAFGEDRIEEEAYTLSAYGISNDDMFLPGNLSHLSLRRPKKAKKHVKTWPDANDKAALANLSQRLPPSPTTTVSAKPISSRASKVPVAAPTRKRLIFSDSTNSAFSSNGGVRPRVKDFEGNKENIAPVRSRRIHTTHI